jgi:Family of unknown function (DUF5990)
VDERPLRLRVVWPEPIPIASDGRITEFGIQKGRSELLQGHLRHDGSTVYETEASAFRDKHGRLRFRGPCIQGPPEEPFLYLAWRVANETSWIGRGKALLTPLTEEYLTSLPETPCWKQRCYVLVIATRATCSSGE